MSVKNKKIREIAWKPVGLVTFENFAVGGNPEAEEAERNIERLLASGYVASEDFDAALADLSRFTSKRKTVRNMVVASGRGVFARILANDLTYSGVINYGAVGTGNTAVSDGQTQLVAEVKRKGVATRSRTGATVTVRFFFSRSDTSGTFEEFGTFIDGTASANTGQMFNRALTGGWDKTLLEAMTVTVQFELNAA